ncbi:toxin-activating lysine-acyltransferase [Kordiimonas sp.]|uniref:toxin-activating lysine-acyltransferase n=1 Tax=Kordiimonas sp. TaxID=1970157 RepID=UPI003A9519F2
MTKNTAKPKPTPPDRTKGGTKNAAQNATENGLNAAPAAPAGTVTGTPATLGQTFGEMVWLLTQSPLHKQLRLADLEWLLMPPLMLGQARIFRAGAQAVGLALWAYLTPGEAEALGKEGKLGPNGWRHGTNVMDVVTAGRTGKALDLTPPELKADELELWLVDLVCPFATTENKLAQACLSDLITGPLKGKKLKMHKTDPQTGEKSIIELGGA